MLIRGMYPEITYHCGLALDLVCEATGVAAIGTQEMLLDEQPFRILKPGYTYTSNYIQAAMPIPRNKVGTGLEPIQTRLLLERQTSCRGVATWTLWPLPRKLTCINSERMRQTILVVCRTVPSASGRS